MKKNSRIIRCVAMGWLLLSPGMLVAEPEQNTIPWSQLGTAVTEQYKGDGLSVMPTEDGALLTSVFQSLVGHVTARGLRVKSVSTGDKLDLRSVALGRDDGSVLKLAEQGRVLISDGLAQWIRPGLHEEYSVSADGIRQDFVVQERLPGDGPLRVELDVGGARLEPSPSGIWLTFENSGRRLAYHRLHVTDAAGGVLCAQMKVSAAHRLSIVVDDESAVYPIRVDPTITDDAWLTMGTFWGADNAIHAIVGDHDGNIYVGGEFKLIGDVIANRVAKWDPVTQTWSALIGPNGTGVASTVNALALDSMGNLYVGGNFTVAGGVTVNRVAKWDPVLETWSALIGPSGTGVVNSVQALAIDSVGNLYVGGNFTNSGHLTVNRVAKWDPVAETWYALSGPHGTGVGSSNFETVQALTVDSEDNLYVGGSFTSAGGGAANRIAKWDATDATWAGLISVGGNGVNNTVRSLVLDKVGNLYVAGNFTQASGLVANRIAKWNPLTETWAALTGPSGTGVSGGLWSIALDDDDNLYVGGLFTTAGGVEANNVARWDTSLAQWTILGDSDNPGTLRQLRAIFVDQDGDVYIGGDFSAAGSVVAHRIAKWKPSESIWQALSGSLGGGVGGTVMSILPDGEGNLYVGGSFETAGGVIVNNVAKWNPVADEWTALAGPEGTGVTGTALALAMDGQGILYVGGTFFRAGGRIAKNVSRWNPVTQTWSELVLPSGPGNNWVGIGVEDTVRALAYDGSQYMYLGGDFLHVGEDVANRIARINTQGFAYITPLPYDWGETPGVNASVHALEFDGSGALYVVGSFSMAGNITVPQIAIWNPQGEAWSTIPSAGTGTRLALAYDGADGMYFGGNFAHDGYRVAKLDTVSKAWSTLSSSVGQGVDSLVYAIALDGAGNVYVGGTFSNVAMSGGTSSATGIPASRVARWSPTEQEWTPLGSGVDAPVRALAILNGLYVGGDFALAGAKITPGLAMLEIEGVPSLISPVQDVVVNIGDSFELVVIADGIHPLKYQWYKDGASLAGETNSTLMVTSALDTHAGVYTVSISNIMGAIVSSTIVSVRTLPEFVIHPESQNAVSGDAVMFSSTVLGPAPLFVQWLKNGADIPGAINTELYISSVGLDDAGSYQVRASNSYGVIYSETATLAVNIPPSITVQPQSAFIVTDMDIWLSVEAVGSVPLRYEWYQGLSGSVSTPVGSDSSLFNTGALIEPDSYWVRVSNSYGYADSETAFITVGNAPTIDAQPESLTRNVGQSASFSMSASGDGTLNYQWRKNGVNLFGQTGSSLFLASVTGSDAGTYRALVSNEFGSVFSDEATLTVIVPPSVSAHPVSQSVEEGVTVEFNVSVSGTPPFAYQWSRNNQDLAGATNASLTLVDVTTADSGDYRVRVSNPAGEALSQIAVLTVNLPPLITSQPAANSYVAIGSNLTLNVVATGSGDLLYQWFGGISGDVESPVVGATNAAVTLESLVANTSLWLRISSAYGQADSATAFVTVGNPPVVTIHPEPQNLWAGDTLALSVAVTGDGPFTYVWKRNGSTVSVQSQSDLTIPDITTAQAGNYNVIVTNVFSSATSDMAPVQVTELVAPSISQQPISQTVSPGSSVSLQVIATGTAPLLYQWFKNDESIEDATNSVFSINPAFPSDSGAYFVRVSNAGGFLDSSVANLVVADAPIIQLVSPNQVIVTGSNRTLAVQATGTALLEYQWYTGSSGDTDTPVGANSATFNTGALLANASHWVRVSNAAGSADSVTIMTTVRDPVVITAQPQSQTVMAGEQVSLSVTVTGGGPISYQWRRNGANISGANSANYMFTPAFGAGGAFTVVADNGVSQAISETATVTVNSAPFIVTRSPDSVVNAGANVLLSVTADGSAPLSYAWSFEGAAIPDAFASSLLLENVSIFDAGEYSVAVQNSYGSIATGIVVQVNGPPVIMGIAGPTQTNYQSSVTLIATTAGPSLTYAWYRGQPGDTSQPVGSDSSTLISGPLAETTTFWLRLNNPFGSVDSAAHTVTVQQPIPVITSPGTASGSVGTYFSYRILATHGPTSFTANPIPNGLTFNPATGLLSGIPTAAGSVSIALTASNADFSGEKTLLLTIHPPKPVYIGALHWFGRVGDELEIPLEYLNTVSTVSLSSAPAWLTYDAVGHRLVGTPTDEGVFSFQILAGNAGGTSANTLTLAIAVNENTPVITSSAVAVGQVNVAFSHSLAASPEATSFVLLGDLPDGVSFDQGLGLLSGTPLSAGEFPVTARGVNNHGMGPAQSLLLKIEAGAGRPVITSLSVALAQAGQPFTLQLEADPEATSYEALTVPPGLSLNGANGQVSGTPPFVGEYELRVRGVNALGAGKWHTIMVDVRPGPQTPVILGPSFHTGRIGQPMSLQIEASENPLTFEAVDLPSGLSIDPPTGMISGMPEVMGTFAVALRAENAEGIGPVRTVQFSILEAEGAPVILSRGPFPARVGAPFTQVLSATGSPVGWMALSLLPPGLDLDEVTGVLAGTPVQAGRYTFHIQAENAVGDSMPTAIVVDVGPPLNTPNVISASQANLVVGQAFNYTIVADAPVTSIQIGPLPAGLQLNPSTRRIFGTPVNAGVHDVAIQLSNADGAGAPFTLRLNISAGDLVPQLMVLPAYEVDFGELYSLQVTAINGPISAWDFRDLPPGLDYNAVTGLIVGRPVRVGSLTARLSAQNVNGFSPDQLVVFHVRPPDGLPLPVITSPRHVTLAANQAEAAYRITATGMPEETPLPADHRYHASHLPGGMQLDPSTGLLTGPHNLLPGSTHTMYVWAENMHGQGEGVAVQVSRQTETGLVGPGFVSAELGEEIIVNLEAPAGLVISSSRLNTEPELETYPKNLARALYFFGTIPSEQNGAQVILPTHRTGAWNFLFEGVTADGSVYSIGTLVHILPSPNQAVVTSPSEHHAAAGTAIPPYPLTAYSPEGFGPALVELDSALPDGLYRDEDTIAGTIDVPGTYTFRLRAFNDIGGGVPKDVTFFVAPAEAAPFINAVDQGGGGQGGMAVLGRFNLAPMNAPSLMVSGVQGQFLSVTLQTGSAVEEFRATGLPSGLALNRFTGVIAGVPDAVGQTTVTVHARNSAGWGSGIELLFDVVAAEGTPTVIDSGTLLAQVGVPFSYSPTASPAADSYNFRHISDGFVVDPDTFAVDGTFNRPGTVAWQVSGNNAMGPGAWHDVVIEISPASGSPILAQPTAQTGTVGQAFSLQLSASGGTEYYDVDGLPFGLDIDHDTGEVFGLPLQSGVFTNRASAANASGISASIPLVFDILPSPNAPLIISAQTVEWPIGLPSAYQIESDPPAVSFAIGALPGGLTADPLSGLISGTAISAGSHPIPVRGVNDAGEGPLTEVLFILREATVGEAFEVWLDGFPELTEPADRDLLANPSGDGIINLIKFALDMDPTVSGREGLPVGTRITDPENGLPYGVVTIQRNPFAPGLEIIVEVSSSLIDATWFEGGDYIEVLYEDETTLIVRPGPPFSENAQQYIRVRIRILED